MSPTVQDALPYLRIGFVVLLVVFAIPVASGYFTSPTSVLADGSFGGNGSVDGVEVVTIDALGPSQIVAYGPNGSGLYQDRTYDIYHDVDPSPVGNATVMYVASNAQLEASTCAGDAKCMLNVVERVNLTTGSTTRLYSEYTQNTGSSQIHDVDRVNDSVLLVGDINYPDEVYMVNTTTGERIWEWRVSEAYEPESGGMYPSDWTHLNDVASLEDGRVMVNLRNQDQVVFIEPGSGVQENWTLGVDDEHRLLYEQHNPDYIPAENGGPALLVADSENNRIVEYQRSNGTWELSWLWSDPDLQWPRDADRLPNGNTLIVDSHGQRILEVNETGEIVSRRPFPNGGYDVERLGTGDESTGGPSMQAIREGSAGEGESPSDSGENTVKAGVNPVDQVSSCDGVIDCVKQTATDATPSLVLHGVLFALPDWVTPFGGVAFILQTLIVTVWALAEVGVRRGRLLAWVR